MSKNLNYYDNLKLGGGGGKIILICDERTHGGALPKKFLKKVERHQRPK